VQLAGCRFRIRTLCVIGVNKMMCCACVALLYMHAWVANVSPPFYFPFKHTRVTINEVALTYVAVRIPCKLCCRNFHVIPSSSCGRVAHSWRHDYICRDHPLSRTHNFGTAILKLLFPRVNNVIMLPNWYRDIANLSHTKRRANMSDLPGIAQF
jgi:hypothetical protein